MKTLMDRLFFSTLNEDKTMKVGVEVVSCRRGGNTATFDMLNKYFTICGMPVASSQYWITRERTGDIHKFSSLKSDNQKIYTA